MKKFSLEEYIAHPEKKVVTRVGCPVRILCTDRIDKYGNEPIVALIEDNGVEFSLHFRTDGTYYAGGTMEASYDLFFADEKPELTEFEKAVTNCYTRDTSGKLLTQEELVARAKELLENAREELFHNDAVLKEYAETARERGKAEALKDLPRWKKCDVNDIGWSMYTLRCDKETFLYHNGYIIDCQDLEKLPGFKEE